MIVLISHLMIPIEWIRIYIFYYVVKMTQIIFIVTSICNHFILKEKQTNNCLQLNKMVKTHSIFVNSYLLFINKHIKPMRMNFLF